MYRLFFASLISAAPLLASEIAWSKESAPNACCVPCCDLSSHFKLGGSYTWVDISPEGLNSTSGNLGGIVAKYEYRTPDTVYGGLQVNWLQGNTTGGSGSSRSLCYVDVQEQIGYSVPTFCCDWNAFFFTGFGYRHHGENTKEFTGATAVTFDYNQFYVPVGFGIDGQLSSIFSLGLNFEWMPQVYPTVKIDPLDGARWILETKLANFSVGVPFEFDPWEDKVCSFIIEPYFQYWQDGETTAVTPAGLTLGIPENTYYFAGVNLMFKYSF